MAGAAAPDADTSVLLGIFLVLFNMSVGAGLSALERRLISRHSHLRVVLRNLYRELLILGLISFIFVLYSTIFKPSAAVFVSFEFAHILIFVLAIFYTVVVFVTAATSLSMSRHWKAIEAMDLVQYLMNKSKFAELKAERQKHRSLVWRWFLWWRGDVRRLQRYHDAHTVMNFHDIRFQFIYYRKLPAEFNFSAYLRKIKSSTFIELVEPHWTIWAVILTLLLVDLLRRKYEPSPTFDRGVVIGSAMLLWVMSEVLRLKISRVHWALFKHPATYYDDMTSKIQRGSTLADLPDATPLGDERDDLQSGDGSNDNTSGHDGDVDGGATSDGGSPVGDRWRPAHPPPSPVDPASKGRHTSAMELTDITEELPSPPSTPGRPSLERGGLCPPPPRRPRGDVVLEVGALLPASATTRTPVSSVGGSGRLSLDTPSRRRSITFKRRPVVGGPVIPVAPILDSLFHEPKEAAVGGGGGRRAPPGGGWRAPERRRLTGRRRALARRHLTGRRAPPGGRRSTGRRRAPGGGLWTGQRRVPGGCRWTGRRPVPGGRRWTRPRRWSARASALSWPPPPPLPTLKVAATGTGTVEGAGVVKGEPAAAAAVITHRGPPARAGRAPALTNGAVVTAPSSPTGTPWSSPVAPAPFDGAPSTAPRSGSRQRGGRPWGGGLWSARGGPATASVEAIGGTRLERRPLQWRGAVAGRGAAAGGRGAAVGRGRPLPA